MDSIGLRKRGKRETKTGKGKADEGPEKNRGGRRR